MMERLFFHEKFPVLGTFDFFLFFSLCVSPVVWCGEFGFFQRTPVCGLCSVESLNFFKVPLCVGSVLCGVCGP